MTILILHDDLGFLLWLGKILNEAGHKTVPARTVADANALIAFFHLTIDLLIVNLEIGGGADFAAGLGHRQGALRVVTVAAGPSGSLAWPMGLDGVPLRAALPGMGGEPGSASGDELSVAETEWVAVLKQLDRKKKAAGSS